MNYGIGGIISPHTDSDSLKTEKSNEALKFGGTRFITFMTYLSTVEYGGRTIFPHIGLSVKPIKNSALFWFNHDAEMRPDSRSAHMGCPVLFGNKWIANKWIKMSAQINNIPCSLKHRNFSIFNK